MHNLPVGSVLTRVFYAVPDHYTIGETFERRDEAVAQAKRTWRRLQEGTEIPIRAPVVDTWWVMQPPAGPEQHIRVDRVALGEGARPSIRKATMYVDMADPEFHS